MQAFVPKARRPKFELQLRILALDNVPLAAGSSLVKWHLAHSTAAEHRGRTDACPVRDHKVLYHYAATLPVRLTVDKHGMLQSSWIALEVVQEYATVVGRGDRITLGHVRLNLAEYVEASELAAAMGHEPGVTRRYLMQDSRVNSTLHVGIAMRQTEGDRNFIAPPLRTAHVFSGIAGIMAGEKSELDDGGGSPSLHSTSREAGELQDMYRRTLAAYWSAQPGELKADECIEDIFAGGDGWGDREKPYADPPAHLQPPRFTGADSSRGSSAGESDARHVRQQQQQQQGRREPNEVDEFVLREDLCSWRQPG